MDIPVPRTDYDLGALDEADLPADPLEALAAWLEVAADAGVLEPTAMVVATVDGDGRPSSRTVLLRGLGADGLRFYTNVSSRKGAELAGNPACAATFRWDALQRQVNVRGEARLLPAEDAARYFATRPRGSQIAAWASRQSEPLTDRAQLERQVAEVEARFPDPEPVPLPPFWGGYLLVPTAVELWQGRRSRLHDRLRYVRPTPEHPWVLDRLSP